MPENPANDHPTYPFAELPIRRAPTRQDQIYQSLKQQIANSDLRSGDRLLEADVAAAFGVSRSPARRALEMLAAENWLGAAPGRGYFVQGPNLEQPRRAQPLSAQISAQPLWESVFTKLTKDLSALVLFAGFRIKEEDLARHFGVSRTVARDVLSRLHGSGVIEKAPSGHWRAERITAQRVKDLYEIRRLLEPRALMTSAPLLDRPVFADAAARLLHAVEHPAELTTERVNGFERELHIDILAKCPNSEILRVLGGTHILLIANHTMFDIFLGIPREYVLVSIREHLRVFEHLQSGRFADAAEALDDHLDSSAATWLDRFEAVSRTVEMVIPPYLSQLD